MDTPASTASTATPATTPLQPQPATGQPATGQPATPAQVIPTVDQVVQIMQGFTRANIERYLPYIVKAMAAGGLTSKNQLAAVLATLRVETLNFTPVREQRSQASCNSMYNGRMGNASGSNDGYTYRGGGFIQLTGRANYAACSRDIGIDLVADPNKTIDPEVSAKILVWFWKGGNGSNDPYRPAEQGNWPQVRREVNGSSTGHNNDYSRVFKPALDRALAILPSGIDPSAVGALPMPGNYGTGCVDTNGAGSRTVTGGMVGTQADAMTMALGLHMLDRQKQIKLDALLNPAAHLDLLKLAPQKTFEGKNFGDGLDGTMTVEEVVFYCGGTLEMELVAFQPDPNAPAPQVFQHNTNMPLNQNTGATTTVAGAAVPTTGDFMHPCAPNPCTSPVGARGNDNHYGNDYSGSNYTIVAMAAGVVKRVLRTCRVGDARCGGGFGNLVELEHNLSGQMRYTRYAHLDTIDAAIQVGAQVQKGQTLGKMGNTGSSFGDHLHVEVRSSLSFGRTGVLDPYSLIQPTPAKVRRGGPAQPFQ